MSVYLYIINLLLEYQTIKHRNIKRTKDVFVFIIIFMFTKTFFFCQLSNCFHLNALPASKFLWFISLISTIFSCIMHIYIFDLFCLPLFILTDLLLTGVQNTLYYDSWWMWQHVCLTWLSALLMLTSHFLPPHYLHLLHKSARHLGRWQKMEARHAHVPYNA